MSTAATGQRQSGFTLVELMIVVAIIGIIAAVAYPAYQRNIRESNRTEAQSALATFAALQERFFSDHNSYGAIGTVCTKINVASPTEHGFYALTVTLPTPAPTEDTVNCRITANHAASYILTATAVSGTTQASDTGCTTMTLDSTGATTPLPPANCWRGR